VNAGKALKRVAAQSHGPALSHQAIPFPEASQTATDFSERAIGAGARLQLASITSPEASKPASTRRTGRPPPKQRNAICDPAQGHRHGALTCSGKPSQKTLGSGMNRSASCYWRTHPRRKEVVKSSDLCGWSDGPISITFLCRHTPAFPP